MPELALVSLGFMNEILTESSNDRYDYPLKATQEDINNFFGG